VHTILRESPSCTTRALSAMWDKSTAYGQLHEFPADFTDEQIATALKSTIIRNPWVTLGVWASIAFGIPLVVLALGASLVWAFSGFAAKRP